MEYVSCSPLSPGLAHETLLHHGQPQAGQHLAVPSRRGLLMKPTWSSGVVSSRSLAVPSRRGLLMKRSTPPGSTGRHPSCSPLSPGLAHETENSSKFILLAPH